MGEVPVDVDEAAALKYVDEVAVDDGETVLENADEVEAEEGEVPEKVEELVVEYGEVVE